MLLIYVEKFSSCLVWLVLFGFFCKLPSMFITNLRTDLAAEITHLQSSNFSLSLNLIKRLLNLHKSLNRSYGDNGPQQRLRSKKKPEHTLFVSESQQVTHSTFCFDSLKEKVKNDNLFQSCSSRAILSRKNCNSCFQSRKYILRIVV